MSFLQRRRAMAGGAMIATAQGLRSGPMAGSYSVAGMALCMALLGNCGALQAAEARDTERCRALNDDAERLRCYDTLFPRTSAPSAQSAPRDQPPQPPAQTSGQGSLDSNGMFGLTGAQERAAAGTKIVERISASVTELRHERDGRFVVYLDNGQVWRQIETDTWSAPRQGERITIRRAAFGSYLLETDENLATHVRRIR